MRAAFLAVLVAATACGNDEAVIDAPGQPADDAAADASDGGVPDAIIDADLRCSACGADQICVAYHDGTCSGALVECQDRHPTCQGLTCTQGGDCEFWHCRRGMDAGTSYICYSCPNDLPGALNCHGP